MVLSLIKQCFPKRTQKNHKEFSTPYRGSRYEFSRSSTCYKLSRRETVDTTRGARRKGDARRLTVRYANGGGTDSADGGNTSSIWQNCCIIPQGICTTILCISEEQFGLVLLIVDPLWEPLLEEHLIRLVADG